MYFECLGWAFVVGVVLLGAICIVLKRTSTALTEVVFGVVALIMTLFAVKGPLSWARSSMLCQISDSDTWPLRASSSLPSTAY
jgi:hypothetical protein